MAEVIATAGVTGLSLLRILGQRDGGDLNYRRFCYSTCGNVSPAAALQLTAGPASLETFDNFGPDGEKHAVPTAPSNADAPTLPSNAAAPSQSGQKSLPVSSIVDPEPATGLDTPEAVIPSGITALVDESIDYSSEINWHNGPSVGCALGGCSSDLPLPHKPVTTGGSKKFSTNTDYPTELPLNTPVLTLEQVPVIVNPEPGTWALVAAGIGGLALVRRRRR